MVLRLGPHRQREDSGIDRQEVAGIESHPEQSGSDGPSRLEPLLSSDSL